MPPRSTAGRLSPRPAGNSPFQRAQNRAFWPFMTPALVLFLLFFVAPIVFSVWLSFHSWDGITDIHARGGKNYRQLFLDPTFRAALRNTGLILVVGGLITFVLSFAITLFLREMVGRKFVRYVLFFPVLVNPLVFGVMAGLLFRPDGVVNHLLRTLGVTDPPKWLAMDNIFTLILATTIWAAVGFYTTIIMSAVEQIPVYYYEAAELDGAGAWTKFRHITLPLSWEVVTVCALLWTIASIRVFELVLVFGGSTGGTPPPQTYTTALYVYETGFSAKAQHDFGVASAAALVSLVLITVVAVLLRSVMRRDAVEV
ncbi:sugar ABC transporter permease [Streptomyces sp. NPDC051976]|uniref:carbohydrate ABC transporter permease n=1 Tax=Streptomyces sp. NPDC051976 TaxID=3154947 RepID=UPI0034372220